MWQICQAISVCYSDPLCCLCNSLLFLYKSYNTTWVFNLHMLLLAEDDSDLRPNRTTSVQSQISDAGVLNSVETDVEGMPCFLHLLFSEAVYCFDHCFVVTTAVRARVPHGFLLASQNSTPRLTPPGSPPSLSASVSPSRTPKPVSPRRQRHSISIPSTRGIYDDRSSVFSSMPQSQFSSMSSMESGSQPG